ncbi:MAG: hypothetical protein ACOC00_00030 [Halothiobacillaceae bacterium]
MRRFGKGRIYVEPLVPLPEAEAIALLLGAIASDGDVQAIIRTHRYTLTRRSLLRWQRAIHLAKQDHHAGN